MRTHYIRTRATAKTQQPDGWLESANCAGTDPDTFFPEDVQASSVQRREREEAAKRICARCPVIVECLRDALKHERGLVPGGRFGISGGLNPLERREYEIITKLEKR